MRILIYSAYYEPEKAASLYLSTELYEGLAKSGCIVDLFVPMPTRGIDEKTRKQYKCKKIEEKCNGNLRIHRVSLFRESKNIVLRAIRYILMNIIFVLKSLTVKADLIFVQSTPPTQGLMAAIIKRLKHIPFVYNLQDVFPDSLVGLGMTNEKSLVWRIGKKIELITYRNADNIIVISDAIRDNIRKKGVPDNKIHRIYNWVNVENVFPVKREENPVYERYKIEKEKFNIVYAGNLGYAQNIEAILNIAYELKSNEDIRFIIFGEGAQKQYYMDRASEKGLSNITFLPLLPYDEVSYVYSLGDICMLTCKKGFGKSAMPSKMWNIMACGSPVLAIFDSESDVEHIVKDENIGYFVDTEEYLDAVEIINKAKENKKELIEKGKNARLAVEKKYCSQMAVKEYYKVILKGK